MQGRVLLSLALVLYASWYPVPRLGRSEGKPLCSGEYSRTRDDAGHSKLVPFDSWSMYQLTNGTYTVKMSMIFPSTTTGRSEKGISQSVTYDHNMSPTSYTLIDSVSRPDSKTTEVHCRYYPSKLECSVGQSGDLRRPVASIRQTERFAFLPYPLLTFDLPWSYRDIASKGERVTGKMITVPIIGFSTEEGDSESSLTLEGTNAVEYLGEESFTVANQPVTAHKFRTWDTASGPSTFTDVWLSNSGLVLQLGQNGSLDFILSKYSGPSL